jgi:DNA-binding CsgD family transcriptional regulator
LALARATHADWTIPRFLQKLGSCALERGDLPRAASSIAESLLLIRDGWGIFGGIQFNTFFMSAAAACLEVIGQMAVTKGMAERAARLCGAAEMLRERHGIPVSALAQARIDRMLALNRAQLSDAAFATAWSSGRNLLPEAACTEALEFAHSVMVNASRPRTTTAGLTSREQDVLRLLAEGRSNRVIGDMLSISERTVEVHVLHILTKLDLESRTAAAAYAVRHDLA